MAIIRKLIVTSFYAWNGCGEGHIMLNMSYHGILVSSSMVFN